MSYAIQVYITVYTGQASFYSTISQPMSEVHSCFYLIGDAGFIDATFEYLPNMLNLVPV